MPLRWLALGAALVACGCVLDPIPLAQRQCPCAPGWRCVIDVDACERCSPGEPCEDVWLDAGVMDAGGIDATADAAGGDGGAADADDGGVDLDAGALPDAWVPPDAGIRSICDRVVPGRVFCTGFERELSADGLSRSVVGTTGSLSVVSAPVFRGMRAGQSISHGDESNARYAFQATISVPGERLHATLWVHRLATPPLDAVYSVSFLSFSGGGTFLSLQMHPTGYIRVGGSTLYRVTTAAVPAGAWTCIRVELPIGTPGQMRLWVRDVVTGEDIEYLVPEAPDAMPSPYTLVRMGVNNSDYPLGMVFDDVAIGTLPQPCD